MSEVVVALRYDISPHIGMGHASRARVLARAFKQHGVKIIHAVPEHAIPVVKTWTPACQAVMAVDSNDSLWKVSRSAANHIIVDTLWHTNALGTAQEVKHINEQSDALITVIDSLPPDHFSCSDCTVHILLTPYLHADRYRPEPSKNTHWLTGAHFSLLNQEYDRYKNSRDTLPQPSILISCGGSDRDQFSLEICKILSRTQVALDVVIGPLFCDTLVDKLEIISEKQPTLRLHYQPSSLAPLIARTSLVIGRPSLLRYEAAVLSRHAVYLAKGNAYKDYYHGFKEAGIAEIFFETETDGNARFANRITDIAQKIHSGNFNPYNALAGLAVKSEGAKLLVKQLLH